jgi:uncharacterized protein (TIGR03032 family)
MENPPATSIALNIGPGFGKWLEAADATVVVTTYQAGKIILVDHDGEKVTVLMRDLYAPMGLALDGRRMAVALRDRVTVFADSPELARTMPGRPADTFEHLYAPRITYTTGDIRAHEIAFGGDGLWVVSTRFLACASPARTTRSSPNGGRSSCRPACRKTAVT